MHWNNWMCSKRRYAQQQRQALESMLSGKPSHAAVGLNAGPSVESHTERIRGSLSIILENLCQRTRAFGLTIGTAKTGH